MKVLIVSATFYPQNSPRSFRTTELSKELARQGHEVKVYIPDVQHDYSELKENFPALEVCQTKELTWKDIKLHGSGLKYWIRRIFRRIFVQFFEYPAIQWYLKMPHILKNEREYDLLISIAVPHPIHWGIARCFMKGMNLSKIWVADCGDPYMGCKTLSYKPPFYFARFEKLFCRRANYITIPIETAKEGYYPEFRDKMRVIPQAFNFDEIKICVPYIPNEIITFAYAGTFVQGERDPEPVLEYLSKSNSDFRFVVYTRQRSLFDKYVPVLGDKLVLKNYIPRTELLYEMSKMDFLLNLEYGTTVQRPSKLIDYALIQRPILSIYSQQLDIDKLNKFLHRDYSQQFNIENIEDFKIKNAAKKFIDLAACHKNG